MLASPWPPNVTAPLLQTIGLKGCLGCAFLKAHRILGAHVPVGNSLLYVLSPSPSCALMVLSSLMNLFLCLLVGHTVIGLQASFCMSKSYVVFNAVLFVQHHHCHPLFTVRMTQNDFMSSCWVISITSGVILLRMPMMPLNTIALLLHGIVSCFCSLILIFSFDSMGNISPSITLVIS